MGGGAAGLLFRQVGIYWFLHDRVQEAAYALIPEGERAAEHLRIGRLLAAGTPPDAVEESVFEIVSQLNRGAALITAAEEREQLAGTQPARRPARQGLNRICLRADLSHHRRGAVAGQCVGAPARARLRARVRPNASSSRAR